MSTSKDSVHAVARELSQLLTLQDRILATLSDVRDQLSHPQTEELLKAYRMVSDKEERLMSQVLAGMEQVILDLKVAEAEVRSVLTRDSEDSDSPHIAGLPAMPARLERFLAQRSETPGFEYEVLEDPVRGWIVRWKEFTAFGTVRGHGQFYERPYAWLDD